MSEGIDPATPRTLAPIVRSSQRRGLDRNRTCPGVYYVNGCHLCTDLTVRIGKKRRGDLHVDVSVLADILRRYMPPRTDDLTVLAYAHAVSGFVKDWTRRDETHRVVEE